VSSPRLLQARRERYSWGMHIITRDDLRDLIDRRAPVTVLEALPEPYFRKGHLPGARQFPHDRAAEAAAAMLPDKHAAVVIYCASATCANSHVAAEALSALGYTDVRVYVEGKQDWQAAGLPLEL